MLNNPIKREIVKQGAVLAAASGGDPLAVALSAALGIAVETLGYLGEKRTKELFITQEFLNKVIDEVKKSDDFASFVYDLWARHNLESSETRRAMLRSILKNATYTDMREFENFTKLITTAQQINSREVKILDVFYHEDAHTFSKLPGQSSEFYKLSARDAGELLTGNGLINEGEKNTIVLNQLCYFGLVGTHIAMDGEYYMPVPFGRIFLEYISDDCEVA